MAAVFAAAGFDVPAAAVAADELRRGDAAATAPTGPTRASASRSPTSAAVPGTEFKVFSGALDAPTCYQRPSVAQNHAHVTNLNLHKISPEKFHPRQNP